MPMDQERSDIRCSVDLRNMLQDALNSDACSSLVDFTFKVHQIVLSACSSVFKCIIDNIPDISSISDLKAIHYQELETIIAVADKENKLTFRKCKNLTFVCFDMPKYRVVLL